MKSEIRIERLTEQNRDDLHRANEPFDVIGRLSVTFSDGTWQS